MRLVILALCLLHLPRISGATAAEIAAAVGRRYDEAATAKVGAVAGLDGWYFLTAELRSYSRGRFWGSDAAKAVRAEKDQDPLAAIVAFDHMAKAAGITLIVVPVPGKISLNAEALDPALVSRERWDVAQAAFNAALAAEGVQVVDLMVDLLALRATGVATHCRQDSHWSPAAVRVAARRIAALVKAQAWFATAPARAIARQPPMAVSVHGDLVAMLGLKDTPAENLTIEQVPGAEPDRASPIVLMGDSHTLVFHDPELLADHAGLSEQLAAELGMPVDLVGVRGSGANASRIALARRKDNLAGKRCLVWVFSASELTESLDGWRAVPVIR